MRLVHFQRGSVIYFDKSREDVVFILQRGKVVITRQGINKNDQEAEELVPGNIFGIQGAFASCERGETATAQIDCDVLCLTSNEFLARFGNNRELMFSILRYFSFKLRNANRKIERLLKNGQRGTHHDEIITVVESFFKERKWLICYELCCRYENMDIKTNSRRRLAALKAESQKRLQSETQSSEEILAEDEAMYSEFPKSALVRKSIPGFERFSRKYKRGQVIIAEFEPGMTFYFIQSGIVQLTMCAHSSDINVDFLTPGELFGEMAILDNSPRSATCIARTDVEVLEFTKENFAQIVGQNPAIIHSLLRIFCKRLYNQRKRFKVVSKTEPISRIASVFLMYDEMRPSKFPNERRRTFSLTISDISRWTGLSLFDAYWNLSLMVDEMDIYVTKTRITIDIFQMRQAIRTEELKYKQKTQNQLFGGA